jgi:hypothetical protein
VRGLIAAGLLVEIEVNAIVATDRRAEGGVACRDRRAFSGSHSHHAHAGVPEIHALEFQESGGEPSPTMNPLKPSVGSFPNPWRLSRSDPSTRSGENDEAANRAA